jgi:hypothetical protein
MAKAKRRVVSSREAPVTKIVRAPAQIIKVQAPRAPAKRKATRRRRRSSGTSMSGAVGGLVSSEAIQMAVGGALYGYAVKSGLVAKLPAIPVLGRTGTAAILLDYWARHGGGQIAHRAARAAAAIAGYQLGNEGKISGDFSMGDADPADMVHGDDSDSY